MSRGLQQLRGPLGGGTAGPRGSSGCVAPSAWHWLGFRSATIWCPEQLRTSGQKEEASCCRPCLPLPTAELFLICRRCSHPGAIKYLTDVRIAIRLRCRRLARSPLAHSVPAPASVAGSPGAQMGYVAPVASCPRVGEMVLTPRGVPLDLLLQGPPSGSRLSFRASERPPLAGPKVGRGG